MELSPLIGKFSAFCPFFVLGLVKGRNGLLPISAYEERCTCFDGHKARKLNVVDP